jgi:hypothetical protein
MIYCSEAVPCSALVQRLESFDVEGAEMEMLTFLGRTLGFSFAAGVNLYATIGILGLASRYDWVNLPSEYQVFDNDWVIALAILLYFVEFFADKIPWIDSIWDALHTIVRPAGGALIAVSTLGEASPAMTAVMALLGGTAAFSSHATKAGTRLVANSSPEPFSNWVLSFTEDAFVIGLGVLALKYPIAALVVSGLLIVTIAATLTLLVRLLRRRFRAAT